MVHGQASRFAKLYRTPCWSMSGPQALGRGSITLHREWSLAPASDTSLITALLHFHLQSQPNISTENKDSEEPKVLRGCAAHPSFKLVDDHLVTQLGEQYHCHLDFLVDHVQRNRTEQCVSC